MIIQGYTKINWQINKKLLANNILYKESDQAL